MGFKNFWYVVAEARELAPGRVLGRQVLDEWLVCFRAADGRPAVLQDRCLHRCARLSRGRWEAGRLHCPYHGWVYDGAGRVVAMPAAVADDRQFRTRTYPTREQHGYVYVRLTAGDDGVAPFPMPHHGEPGWHSIRLQNRFQAALADCVENFIDVPHTAFVHCGTFRASRGERIRARIERRHGEVHVRYHNERRNLGAFARFLNPRGGEIEHTDSFHPPNVTCVRYRLGPERDFVITSQAVPVAACETLVYTDLSYRFGLWTRPAAWLVRRQARRVIDQDLRILAEQAAVIGKYGRRFTDTPADLIHAWVDSIREAIARGEDPRRLPEREAEVEFRV